MSTHRGYRSASSRPSGLLLLVLILVVLGAGFGAHGLDSQAVTEYSAGGPMLGPAHHEAVPAVAAADNATHSAGIVRQTSNHAGLAGRCLGLLCALLLGMLGGYRLKRSLDVRLHQVRTHLRRRVPGRRPDPPWHIALSICRC